jgi:PEP-CTERM motif-containing protein
MNIVKTGLLATTALACVALAGQANASLALFNSFTGNELVSTDGCGSTTQNCTLQSNIQAGSTIQAAYLYTSEFFNGPSPAGTTLSVGGNSVMPTFTPLGVNVGAGANLQAFRADVTSFVQANANIGSLTTWTAHESNANQDGEALVIVYSNPTVQPTTHTVSILDGFSSSAGDTSNISFTALPAGFTAQMMIGDGFSFDGTDPNNPTNTAQVSTIKVNGINLTTVAGHCDDAQDAACSNGNLITMGATNAGSHDDPFTPFPCNGLGCIGSDHEHYNLGNILNVGDTSATLMTVNPSGDDNIFLEVFDISGTVVFQAPEPGSLALLGAALAGFGLYGRRRRSRS